MTDRGLAVSVRSAPPRALVSTIAAAPVRARCSHAIAVPPGDQRGFCSRSGSAVVLPVARSTSW
ncbi:MAG TPA: hypothetical protein VF516_19105 [Kofleriaceae bacterium]